MFNPPEEETRGSEAQDNFKTKRNDGRRINQRTKKTSPIYSGRRGRIRRRVQRHHDFGHHYGQAEKSVALVRRGIKKRRRRGENAGKRFNRRRVLSRIPTGGKEQQRKRKHKLKNHDSNRIERSSEILSERHESNHF